MEVLRSATIYIAQAYGVQQDPGTLEPGKIGDLVVLEDNPLEDSTAYQKIRHVIKEGAIVDRDALARDMQVGIDILASRAV